MSARQPFESSILTQRQCKVEGSESYVYIKSSHDLGPTYACLFWFVLLIIRRAVLKGGERGVTCSRPRKTWYVQRKSFVARLDNGIYDGDKTGSVSTWLALSQEKPILGIIGLRVLTFMSRTNLLVAILIYRFYNHKRRRNGVSNRRGTHW